MPRGGRIAAKSFLIQTRRRTLCRTGPPQRCSMRSVRSKMSCLTALTVYRNANRLMHLCNSCRITSRLLSVPQRRHLLLAISNRQSVCVAGAMKVEEGHRMNSRFVQSTHCSHAHHGSPSDWIACTQAAKAPHFCIPARQGRGNQGSADLSPWLRRKSGQASGQESLFQCRCQQLVLSSQFAPVQVQARWASPCDSKAVCSLSHVSADQSPACCVLHSAKL